MSKPVIALIAEDDTDCETIQVIVRRVLGDRTPTRKWASKGCSTLKGKLSAKLSALSAQGCNAFVVIHDLDRNPRNNTLNDESKLRKTLESLSSKLSNTHICIPIEELEAWFWSDPNVVEDVGRGQGKASVNPHEIQKPKEKLMALSKGANRKPRYSTNDNPRLAQLLNLDLCQQRCPAFKRLVIFLQNL